MPAAPGICSNKWPPEESAKAFVQRRSYRKLLEMRLQREFLLKNLPDGSGCYRYHQTKIVYYMITPRRVLHKIYIYRSPLLCEDPFNETAEATVIRRIESLLD